LTLYSKLLASGFFIRTFDANGASKLIHTGCSLAKFTSGHRKIIPGKSLAKQELKRTMAAMIFSTGRQTECRCLNHLPCAFGPLMTAVACVFSERLVPFVAGSGLLLTGCHALRGVLQVQCG
jgi:hypothetical protein